MYTAPRAGRPGIAWICYLMMDYVLDTLGTNSTIKILKMAFQIKGIIQYCINNNTGYHI